MNNHQPPRRSAGTWIVLCCIATLCIALSLSCSRPAEEEKPAYKPTSDLGEGNVIKVDLRPKKAEGARPFWGHRLPVAGVAFDSVGRRVYTAAPGEEIIAWDVNSGRPLQKLEGHAGKQITGMVVDLTDRYLTVGDASQLTIWDLQTFKIHDTFKLPPPRNPDAKNVTITKVAQIYEQGVVLVGDSTGRIIIVHIDKGYEAEIYHTRLSSIGDLTGGVDWIVASGDYETIALDRRREPSPLPISGRMPGFVLQSMRAQGTTVIGSDGSSLMRWGPDFTKPPVAIPGPPHGIRVAISDAYGKRGLVLTRRGVVEFWELKTGKLIKSVEVKDRRPSPVLASDLNGLHMATVDEGGVLIWDMKASKLSRILPNALELNTLDFIPGSHNVVASGVEGRPVVYNLDEPQRLVRYPELLPEPIEEALLDYKTNAYITSTREGHIMIYDLRHGKIVTQLHTNVGPSPQLAINSASDLLAIAPTVRESQTTAERIFIWDLGSNLLRDELTVGSDIVDLIFGVTPEQLYYLTSSGQVESWDMRHQRRRKVFDRLNREGRLLRLDPAGTLIAVGGERGVTFYNTRLEQMAAVEVGPVRDVAFAHKGGWAIIATEGGDLFQVRFDLDEPVNVQALIKVPSNINALAISDDDALIAVAEERGAVTFLDARDGEPVPYASMMLFQGNQWVVSTPDGNFSGSEAAERFLYFEIDGKIVPSFHPEVNWVRNEASINKLVITKEEEMR